MASSGNIFIHEIGGRALEGVKKSTENVGMLSQMVFTDRDAAVFCHFYKDCLTHLRVEFGASFFMEKSEWKDVVKKLEIRYKEEQSDKINRVIMTMKQKMRSLLTKELLVENENLSKLTEFLSNTNSECLFLIDLAIKKVTIIAKSNEEADAAEDDLKTFIGIRKPSTVVYSRSQNFKSNTPTSIVKDKHSTKYECTSSSFSNRHAEEMFSKPDSNDVNFVYRLNNGFVLKVCNASIIHVDVDVIVNAVNETLSNDRGVAFVIADKAGYRVKDECSAYINKYGKLKVCDNCMTSAGDLKYKGIIHAVGPTWHRYQDKVKCLDDLYDCIMNIFSRCNEHHFHSVGMPAISAGIFGVPKELCADMYVKAAVNYSVMLDKKSLSYPEELHVIDVDKEILRLVKASFNRWKQNPNLIDQRNTVPKYLSHPEVKVDRRPNRRGQDHNWIESKFQGPGHSGVATSNLGHHGRNDSYSSDFKIECQLKKMGKTITPNIGDIHVFRIAEAIDLKLYTSAIEKLTDLDAVACGIDTSLQSRGFVMEAIKNVGGRDYNESFQKMVSFNSQKVKTHAVVKCRGGNLGAKYVIFLVMDRILHADKMEVECYQHGIVKFLEMIREKDKDWKIRRIALPLIGTGQIQTNKQKLKACIEALVKGICVFCCRNAKSSLGVVVNEIHLVNNDTSVTSLLLDVFHQVTGFNTSCQKLDQLGPSVYSSSTGPRFNRSSENDADEKSPGNSRARMGSQSENRSSSSSDEEYVDACDSFETPAMISEAEKFKPHENVTQHGNIRIFMNDE